MKPSPESAPGLLWKAGHHGSVRGWFYRHRDEGPGSHSALRSVGSELEDGEHVPSSSSRAMGLPPCEQGPTNKAIRRGSDVRETREGQHSMRK